MRFDRIIVVDWSAASHPSPLRPSADAIWIGVASTSGDTVGYHRTRAAAEAALQDLLGMEGSALVGFDFPMGYPAGFAERLTGRPSARAIHGWLANAIQDSPANCNNRFEVAARINRQFGKGPFWGCPAGVDLPGLSPRKTVDYAAIGLQERREVEQVVRKAQPVWKLYTTGSVGSQALTGLPVVHRLGLPVWPFDPPAPRMIAEVYPSLIAPAVALEGGIKDAAQVRLLARALFNLSKRNELAPFLATPSAGAAREEGWILGAGHSDRLQEALAWA